MNIAIIPARGGSKRLKNKNIFPFLGKPLIEYSIEACLNSKSIDKVFVSSENKEILDVSEKLGAIPLPREEHLADDVTPKIIAIRAAVDDLKKLNLLPTNVAIVQANSPQLTAEFLDAAFDKFEKYKLWEIMSTDENGVQNAALRIVKTQALYNTFLSAHCGFIQKDMLDVHTIDDIRTLEKLMS